MISDGHDSAVVTSAGEVEDFEDALALLEWRRDGSPVVGTLEESAGELGIDLSETHESAA